MTKSDVWEHCIWCLKSLYACYFFYTEPTTTDNVDLSNSHTVCNSVDLSKYQTLPFELDLPVCVQWLSHLPDLSGWNIS